MAKRRPEPLDEASRVGPVENAWGSPESRTAALARLARSGYLRRYGTVTVGVLGLSATIVSFQLLQDREGDLRDRDFQDAAKVAGRLAERELESGIAALRCLVSFYISSVDVERHEFKSFSETLIDEAQIVSAVAWAPAVLAEERAEHEREARRKATSPSKTLPENVAQALANYRICEWRDDGVRTPVEGDQVSYPILYVEPFDTHRELLGVDLATRRDVGEAIERARIPTQRESAGNVCLPGTPPQDLCFLVLARVVKSGSAAGEGNGPPNGVLLGVFRIAALVGALKEKVGSTWFDIQPEFDTELEGPSEEEPGELLIQILPTEAKGLGLRFIRKDPFSANRVAAAPLVLVLGLSFTALLVAYVFSLTHWSSRVERQVAQRTEELRDANTRLSSEIAERRLAEHKLELQADELARSNSDLEEFAYLASHDLRAPLRAIANISEWLEEDLGGSLKGDSRRQLDLLRKRVVRMENLIDDLLAYSRAGRDQAPQETVDTRELVENVVFLINPPAAFVVEVDGSMPVIETRRVPLEQVFANLIGNSIKHHDRKDGTVRVGARRLDGFYEFSVADDGPGIEKQFHERIFKMFHSLQPRDKVEGSGMGLALVKKLVTRQGGSVRVHSDPGKGTCFAFTWPLAPSCKEA